MVSEAEDVSTLLSAPITRSLATDVASRLRTAIVRGHFAPSERLREERLAKTMGVSRAPVREALNQLEREGLVVIQRNRGAFVARLTREDAEEIYSLRLTLERMAIRRAILHIEPAQLAQMQRLVDTVAARIESGISEHEAAELDVRFHEVLFQASDHRRLYECWSTMRLQVQILLLNWNVVDANFRPRSVLSHQEIIHALADRDERRALAAITTHIQGSYERVVAQMEPSRGEGDDDAGSESPER